MSELIELREKGKIKEIIQLLQKEDSKIKLPESILKTEKELSKSNNTEEQNLSSQLKESKALHDISYSEIIALKKALDENSPFQTQHGVKGAEFENVLIVIGRGWNQYNFGEMLKWVGTGIPNGKEENFERNRNLFYVSCSRAKKRLAILFTQELEETAIETLNKWFDPDNI
ncbi:TPA: ATP-dependent helicase, partial [Pasteurella multocida]|nr:ATP-dependent helicase [Pasteurella multocida]